jgi:TonB family protein
MMRPVAVLLSLLVAAPLTAQQTQADSARVYELAEVEVLPRPRNSADLIAALNQGYPQHLREAGVGGTVQVAFVVNTGGEPADVRVLSTPDSAFNAPTVQAVSLLRFTPAQVQGRAVAVRVEQPITWRVAPAAVAPPPVAVTNRVSELVGDDTVGVYGLGQVDAPPRPINVATFQRALAQRYPSKLRDAGRSGQVEVQFIVEEDGSVSHLGIVRFTDAAFNQPTIEAVSLLRFRPGRVNGRPVRTWVQQPVEWSVQTEPTPLHELLPRP